MHGNEYLHVAWAKAIAGWQPLRHQVHRQLGSRRWILRRQEEGVGAITAKLQQLTRQDPLRVPSDAGAGTLAEETCQPGDREMPRAQQSSEDITSADTGELIRVTNQQEMCARSERFDELIGQEHIEHTGLVHDHQIGVEWVFWASPGLAAGA
jgi:hypothetical protein